MENITFTVTQQEAEAIVAVLGQLPTQTNAYPLYLKVTEQVKKTAKPATTEDTPITE